MINNIDNLFTLEAVTNYTWTLFLNIFVYVTLCPIMPRFIISMRELYDRDLCGRWQGIDTGFGVFSHPAASQNAAMSAIAFADVTPGQDELTDAGVDKSEPIQLEVLGDDTRRV